MAGDPATKQPTRTRSKTAPKRTPKRKRKSTYVRKKTKLSDSEIIAMFETFKAESPAPRTELEYKNPFTLLIAVLLSAQATDVGVNKATKTLFERADTPEKMVALGEDRVRDLIKTIGLFRNKAKNTILTSQALIDHHNGEVPEDRDALEQLPGVGRKTANVVMNEAFGHPTMAVDTHIFRVSNRTGLAPGKDPLAVEVQLLKAVPADYALHAHHWLILHGRYICLARKPKCAACPIIAQCRFKQKTISTTPKA